MNNFDPFKALVSKLDLRDHKWKRIGAGTEAFDWEKGFDIEEKLGFSLVPKDQNGSFSCGGQAGAVYAAVWDYFIHDHYTEKSARDIYSQIAYPGGGTTLRDIMDLLKKKGVCLETLMTSYENGKPPSEKFMLQKGQSPATIEDAKTTLTDGYADVEIDIDSLAQAASYNNGLIFLFQGQNNGTVYSEFPIPPNQSKYTWRHFVYLGKAKLIDGKKKIAYLNSLGPTAGQNGWQWIGEEWIPWIIEAKTMYDSKDPVIAPQITAVQASLFYQILTQIQKILILLGMQSKLPK